MLRKLVAVSPETLGVRAVTEPVEMALTERVLNVASLAGVAHDAVDTLAVPSLRDGDVGVPCVWVEFK